MLNMKLGRRAAPPEIRLIDRSTGHYLHLSGRGEVQGRAYAWSGTRAQARELRRRAIEAGRDWPFTAIRNGGTE